MSPVGPMEAARRKCYGWLDWLCRIWTILFRKKGKGDRCVYFPERVANRPDPCIYSQFLLMQIGQPVTWDNPDIAILLGGVEQFTFGLKPATLYDVLITVHNSSQRKAADGTQVDVRWIEFGAGGQIRHHITTTSVNVPVWPGTAQVKTQWQTPATPGHFCIEVQLTHGNDANPANNLGWNNTVVKAAASQVQTPIRIFNRTPAQPHEVFEKTGDDDRRRPPVWNVVEVTFDSYVFRDAYGEDVDAGAMFAPRPPAWPARVEPALFHFRPDETYRDVMLIVDAPAGPGDSETFNVTARQGGAPLGGVTVTITRG